MSVGPDHRQGEPERKRRLIVEFELPSFYCDDLPEILTEYGDPDEPMGEKILNEISVNVGALTVQIIGEKSGETVTVPAIARTARIEDEPPDAEDLSDIVERLMADATEMAIEKAHNEGYDEGCKDGNPDQYAALIRIASADPDDAATDPPTRWLADLRSVVSIAEKALDAGEAGGPA